MTVVDTRGGVPRAAGSFRSGRNGNSSDPATPGRGTQAAVALALAAAVSGVGMTWAALAGAATDRQTPASFVVAAVAAVAVARRASLKATLIGLPLIWIVMAVVAGLVQAHQDTGTFKLTDVGTSVLSVTVLQAPWLWAGMGLAACIAFLRGAFKS